MHRFFIPPEWIDGKRVVVRGRQVHQLRDVLRLSVGDSIAVLDNTGREYQVELETVARGCARGVVTAESMVAEPRTAITLYQALLKAGRFELIIQKCTELGVARFVPMMCQRCVVRGPEAASGRKLERWRRIIVEAAEQSGRGRLPVLEAAVTFEEACRAAAGFSLLPWEGEKTLGLRAALRDEADRQVSRGDSPWRAHHERPVEGPVPTEASLSVNLFIGPEGGFASAEVEFARSCGIVPVTLGGRVLRAETAGLVAASAILYECGDLDPPASG